MNILFGAAPGGMQIILIVGIILLFFGGSRLPGLAKGLGESVREFKKAKNDDKKK